MSATRHSRDNEVVTHVQARLRLPDGGQLEVAATLSYRSSDPYAVTATFHTPTADVAWVFARDLLGAGLDRPVGLGDVRVAPGGGDGDRGDGDIALTLSSPDGRALLGIDRASVGTFLRRTYRLVPAGRESDQLDLDAMVAALVASRS